MPGLPISFTATQLFESSGCALLVVEPHTYRIVQANPISQALFKIDNRSTDTLTLPQLLENGPNETKADLQSRLAGCLVDGCDRQVFQFTSLDRRSFSGTMVLRLFSQDTDAAILVTISDVSDQEALRKREVEADADFNLLFEQMSEGVALHEIIYDNSGVAVDYRVLKVNRQFTQHTGIPVDQANGAIASQLYQSNPPPFLHEYAQVAATGKSTQFEIFFPPMNRHFIISVASMRVGTFATIFFDVTELKNSEQRLAESQAFVASITKAVPDLIYVFSLEEQRFLFLNRDIVPNSNESRAASKDDSETPAWDPQDLLTLFEPEDRAMLEEVHLKAINALPDGQVYNFEHRVRGAKGQVVWINQRVMVFQRNEQGQAKTLLGVAEDITRRKQLESELDTLFRNSFDLIVVSNSQGYFTKVNPAWTRLLGWTEQELLTKHYLEFVHPDDVESTIKQTTHTNSVPGVSEFENRYRCRDGSYRWLAWSYFVQDGLFYAIARDITDRKSVIQNLQELNLRLERGLQERSRDLENIRKLNQQAYDQLLASEKLAQLGELVAGITHEVNTPLGLAITAGTFLNSRAQKLGAALEANLANPNQGFSRKYLSDEIAAIREASDLVLTNVGRANEIIATFKEQSMDQASQRRRCFQLQKVIDQTIFSLQPRLRHTPIALKVSCAPELEMDSYPGDISQILTNLIMNSLLHGFEGYESGTITIAVNHLLDSAAPQVRLEYSDDGMGIPPDLLDRVFEPFYTTKSGRGGSGMGLHIVRSLVTQRLGGKLRLESQAAQADQPGFSRFILDLPMTSPSLSH